MATCYIHVTTLRYNNKHGPLSTRLEPRSITCNPTSTCKQAKRSSTNTSPSVEPSKSQKAISNRKEIHVIISRKLLDHAIKKLMESNGL